MACVVLHCSILVKPWSDFHGVHLYSVPRHGSLVLSRYSLTSQFKKWLHIVSDKNFMDRRMGKTEILLALQLALNTPGPQVPFPEFENPSLFFLSYFRGGRL
jgi:hypothetical protein